MVNPYNQDLDANSANYQPLTPLSFLERAADVFPEFTAIVHGNLRRSYAEFYLRSKKLASALSQQGMTRGSTISTLLLNTPPMLEAHYAHLKQMLDDEGRNDAPPSGREWQLEMQPRAALQTKGTSQEVLFDSLAA